MYNPLDRVVIDLELHSRFNGPGQLVTRFVNTSQDSGADALLDLKVNGLVIVEYMFHRMIHSASGFF